MAEFAYNNAKNTSIGHTSFELNCSFHPRASYKKDVDLRSQSKSADKLATKLKELVAVCRENLQHAQELQKQYHNKYAKLKSYAPDEKVWLNSKYIKTKQNCKLKAKFFEPFRVLHPIGKQAYKSELSRKWRIYDVFHVSLLEQNITRKGWVEIAVKLDKGDSEEYEVEAIRNSAVYIKESDNSHHLPGLYYLVLWKDYPEEENTWEPILAVLHFCKLINTFYHNHLEKPTVTFLSIDSAPPMTRPTAKPRAETSSKQKRNRPAKDNSASKYTKKTWTSSFYLVFGPIFIAGKKSLQSHNLIPLRPAVWFFVSFHFSIFIQSFRFFLLSIGQEIFSTNYLDFSVFLHQSSKRLEVFSSINPPVFFHHFPLVFWRFFTYAISITTLIIYLYVYWSSYPRRKAIVMTGHLT